MKQIATIHNCLTSLYKKIDWNELDKINSLTSVELKGELHRTILKCEKLKKCLEEQQTTKHLLTSEKKDC